MAQNDRLVPLIDLTTYYYSRIAPRLEAAAVARIEHSLTVERSYRSKPTYERIRQLAFNHYYSKTTIYYYYKRLEKGIEAKGKKGGQRKVIIFEVKWRSINSSTTCLSSFKIRYRNFYIKPLTLRLGNLQSVKL